MKPIEMSRIVFRKRYDTRSAIMLASDCYWDGHNWERRGRNTWLYRTPKGAYFTVTRTQWQGEEDRLEPVDLDTAISLFEGPLSVHEVSYAEAFPGVEVTEA